MKEDFRAAPGVARMIGSVGFKARERSRGIHGDVSSIMINV